MKITDLDPETYAALLAAGKVSEKDQSTWNRVQAKLVAKPMVQDIPKVVTKTGELELLWGQRKGQKIDLGITTEVKEKGGKKWLSSTVNTGFGHGKYLYSNPEELKSLALAIADHLDALAAAGYKFKN